MVSEVLDHPGLEQVVATADAQSETCSGDLEGH